MRLASVTCIEFIAKWRVMRLTCLLHTCFSARDGCLIGCALVVSLLALRSVFIHFVEAGLTFLPSMPGPPRPPQFPPYPADYHLPACTPPGASVSVDGSYSGVVAAAGPVKAPPVRPAVVKAPPPCIGSYPTTPLPPQPSRPPPRPPSSALASDAPLAIAVASSWLPAPPPPLQKQPRILEPPQSKAPAEPEHAAHSQPVPALVDYPEILLLPGPGEVFAVVWEVQGDTDGVWIDYDLQYACDLEAKYRGDGATFKRTPGKNIEFAYDVKQMLQHNLKYNTRRVMRRMIIKLVHLAAARKSIQDQVDYNKKSWTDYQSQTWAETQWRAPQSQGSSKKNCSGWKW